MRTCPECQLGKDYKQRHLPKGTIESSKPWDVVSIDIMGPFPYDDQAKRFIATIMDVYSRYIMAIPVQNHTTQTVSKCQYEHVVAYFGVPRSILSDRGRNSPVVSGNPLHRFLEQISGWLLHIIPKEMQ